MKQEKINMGGSNQIHAQKIHSKLPTKKTI